MCLQSRNLYRLRNKISKILSPVALCIHAILPLSCHGFSIIVVSVRISSIRQSYSGDYWGNIVSNKWKMRSTTTSQGDVPVFSTSRRFSYNSGDSMLSSNTVAQNDYVSSIYQTFHVGDWAGQLSNFDSQSGDLIPVPENVVPKAMIEWGQIPPQLEVLSSETLEPVALNLWNLQRTTVTVFPDVGCGCDNLETRKVKESIVFTSNDVAASDKAPSTNNIFSIPYSVSAAKIFPDGALIVAHQKVAWKTSKPTRYEIICTIPVEKVNEYEHRTRISFEIDLGNQECTIIKSPVSIIKERRISNISSNGSISDGGGLDSRTVANLVGIEAINKPFAIRNIANAFSFEGEAVTSIVGNHVTSVTMPGGVMLRCIRPTIMVDDEGDFIDYMLLEIIVSSNAEGATDTLEKQCVIRVRFSCKA